MSTEVDDATTFCVETLSFFFVWLFETTYTLSSAELETERGDITDDSSIHENVCAHLEILSSPNFPGRFKKCDIKKLKEKIYIYICYQMFWFPLPRKHSCDLTDELFVLQFIDLVTFENIFTIAA